MADKNGSSLIRVPLSPAEAALVSGYRKRIADLAALPPVQLYLMTQGFVNDILVTVVKNHSQPDGLKFSLNPEGTWLECSISDQPALAPTPDGSQAPILVPAEDPGAFVPANPGDK